MATKTATPSAVEPIDRLEEKIKLLVSVIGRLRGEQARVQEENARLQREVETLNARVTDAESAASELTRDARRTRPDSRPCVRDASAARCVEPLACEGASGARVREVQSASDAGFDATAMAKRTLARTARRCTRCTRRTSCTFGRSRGAER